MGITTNPLATLTIIVIGMECIAWIKARELADLVMIITTNPLATLTIIVIGMECIAWIKARELIIVRMPLSLLFSFLTRSVSLIVVLKQRESNWLKLLVSLLRNLMRDVQLSWHLTMLIKSSCV